MNSWEALSNKNAVMLPMNENCTLNHLVLYLYNETELTETVLVQHAIDSNDEVAETYQDLLAARSLIDKSLLSPGNNALNTVLNYARITAPLSVIS
jgi:hypothetical protein